MRNKNNRLAALDQAAQDPKEFQRFLGREDASRLVKDQDPGATIQDFYDLDALLEADGEIFDAGVGIQGKAVLPRQISNRGSRPGIVIEATRPYRLAAEHDVLADGKNGNQHEMLMDHADAVPDGIAWALHRRRLALDQDLAGVRVNQAVKNVHQRALAGAVFADERMDLALTNCQIDVIVGDNTWEDLDNAAHLDGEPLGVDLVRHSAPGT